ncbi:hypothetical protein TNCV_760841 [Trichonephila clavipes]|nr:hypothetical protein TNCV_760841 [Trichonephila clavipes]
MTNRDPVVRNGLELEAEFYASKQTRGQAPSVLGIVEEGLKNHLEMRLSPPVLDYVEVRNPKTKALLQLKANYKMHVWTYIYGFSCGDRLQERDSSSRSSNRHTDGNWRGRGVANRLVDARVVNKSSNSNQYISGYSNRNSENQLVEDDRGALKNLKLVSDRCEVGNGPQDQINLSIVIWALKDVGNFYTDNVKLTVFDVLFLKICYMYIHEMVHTNEVHISHYVKMSF